MKGYYTKGTMEVGHNPWIVTVLSGTLYLPEAGIQIERGYSSCFNQWEYEQVRLHENIFKKGEVVEVEVEESLLRTIVDLTHQRVKLSESLDPLVTQLILKIKN